MGMTRYEQEQLIIQKIILNDETAFNDTIDLCMRLICFLITQKIPNKNDVDDCLQEVLLHIAQKLFFYTKNKGSLTTYVTMLTKTKINDFLREQYKYEKAIIKSGILHSIPDPISKNETTDILQSSLTEFEYNILILKNGYGLTNIEIGKYYGISREKVRRIHEEAELKARECLGREYE